MFGKKQNPLVTDVNIIEHALRRRVEMSGIFPNKDEAVKLLQATSLRVYLGIDPTGPDIHLGHSIPLLFLKQLWQLGHQPVIVIGDFTGQIGDPTGKSSTRKQLSLKDVKANAHNYVHQIEKILPRGSFEVRHNSDWLSTLSFGEVLHLASHVTVQQMIRRDMFQERLKREEAIGLHEFLYPLMQGYDSVAMKIDGEVGGNDQTFNMLVGRDLEKKILGKEKLVFATRLLVDAASGKKMSKSEGGLIVINDSPADMFGKTMATIPDEMIQTVFELCTEKDIATFPSELKDNPYAYKKELARELVRMYHGQAAAQDAAREFDSVFSKRELPEHIENYTGAGMALVEFITERGLAPSRSEAKRLIEQKAVSVNSLTVTEWGYPLKENDVVQVGPRKFARVT